MKKSPGKISQSNALLLLFRFRAKAAKNRGKPDSIYAAIAENLSKNGGSVPQGTR